MESKDLEAEIHPLKHGEGKAPESPANCAKKASVPKKPGRLSRLRTAAFFLSLFLCLTVVFAFSFVIPCPVRPISEKTWSRTYDQAATYNFLVVEDVDQDRVQDILFAFRAAGDGSNSSSMNASCASEGFASPCAFLTALSGTNGSTLWERPVAEDIFLLDCSPAHVESPHCLVVGKPDMLASINMKTGEILWREAAKLGAGSVVLSPLLKIPDVDGDEGPDFLVFTAKGEKIRSFFYSGKAGHAMTSNRTLHLPGWVGHLLCITKTGAPYVLFHTAYDLYGYSLKELYNMAGGEEGQRGTELQEDPRWEAAIDSTTHHVALFSSGEIRYLTKMPGKLGTNILVVRDAAVELLDEQHLGSLWVVAVPPAISPPVLGSYKPDEVDFVLESRVTPSKKKVMVIEGTAGATEWETVLLSSPGSPKPATLATADHRSFFLFWGEYQEDTNRTDSEATQQNLYLFHPSFPNVLLEMTNSTKSIVTFEAVLFERSRHACYVLLMGPQRDRPPGLVELSKRKLKEDVGSSRVIWLSQVPQDTEQNIRDRFLRIRYRTLY